MQVHINFLHKKLNPRLNKYLGIHVRVRYGNLHHIFLY